MGMNRLKSLKTWQQHWKREQARNVRLMNRYNRIKNEEMFWWYEGRTSAARETLQLLEFLIEMEELRNGNA